MQIGNAGDPGLAVLRAGGENSDLITDSTFRHEIQKPVTGNLNIKAGVAWLIRKAINHTSRLSVVDDEALLTYKTVQHDTLERITRHLNTTQEEIVTQSGLTTAQHNNLAIGTTLKYRKAHHERQITEWHDWMYAIRAYNSLSSTSEHGKGDRAYLDKVTTAYEKIKASR